MSKENIEFINKTWSEWIENNKIPADVFSNPKADIKVKDVSVNWEIDRGDYLQLVIEFNFPLPKKEGKNNNG